MVKRVLIFLLAAVLTICTGCAAGENQPDLGDDPAEEQRSGGQVSYRVKVEDRKGKAVQGVVVRVCSADACVMAVSDENGLIEVNLPSGRYEVNVLKVPEGYTAGGNEPLIAPPGGGETVVVVERKLSR